MLKIIPLQKPGWAKNVKGYGYINTIIGHVICPGCNQKQPIEVDQVGDCPNTAKIIPHKPPGGGKWCAGANKCISDKE